LRNDWEERILIHKMRAVEGGRRGQSLTCLVSRGEPWDWQTKETPFSILLRGPADHRSPS
jgi:hypothetical protein